METGKSALSSKTIAFFSLVLASGGLDIIRSLIEQEVISWRSVAMAIIGLAGIALRLTTTQPIK